MDSVVSMGADLISLCHRTRILGVTFDTRGNVYQVPMGPLSPHEKNVATSARSRLNVLKAQAWGQPQENKVLTYKERIKLILSYATLVWFANASDSAMNSLQVIKIATGSLKMVPWEHLHREKETNARLLVARPPEHLIFGQRSSPWTSLPCHRQISLWP